MATYDIRLSIKESDNSKMCTQSSNKIGLHISPPSNLNPHIKIEVIEGELVNSICKPRTKSLEEDPNQLCEMSLDSNDWSFYKVPYPLRRVNEKAYEPNVISIGPYHHGKKYLETMEVIKRNCFSKMIKENNVETEIFVTVMKKLEEKVRKCYAEPLDGFDSDTFVEMMVLDGCFIVLLFQWNNYLHTSLDKLKKEILAEICYDLLLLENQLPFFVLSELYGLITSNVEINVFSRSAFDLLSQLLPGPDICVPENFPKPEEIKHLLGLVHHCWLLSAGKRHDPEAEEEKETGAETGAGAGEKETGAGAGAEAEAKETKAQSLWKFICCETESEEKGIGRKGSNLIKGNCSTKFIRCATELKEAGINFVNKGAEAKETKSQSLWKFICCETESEEKGIGRRGSNLVKGNCSTKFIRCATELKEAGINCVNKGKELQDKDRKDKIGKEEQDKKGKASLFDIDFTDGKLKIPTLSVHDHTELILRNFMAYEQFLERSKPTYVSDYVTLMDNLINSGKDVQLLCNREIIDNLMGDDEVIAQMFNKLGDFTWSSVGSDDFYYAEIFDKVKGHCKRRRNVWRAKLNKDYFNSPWSTISVLAAFVLLLLTGVQTFFSVLSYYHPK